MFLGDLRPHTHGGFVPGKVVFVQDVHDVRDADDTGDHDPSDCQCELND